MIRQRGVEPILLPILPLLAKVALNVLPRRARPGLEVAFPHHLALQQLWAEEGLEQPHRRPHPDEHLAQVREDGQRHHGIGREMQGMNFVEIKNLMEEPAKWRDKLHHGEGQEVHGSLWVPRPRPRLPHPHGGVLPHDLADEAKVPLCRDARRQEHSVTNVLGHGGRRENGEEFGVHNSVEREKR